MENFSFSDIKSVLGDGDGFGGGWVLIVVLFLFMIGFGRNGFGGQSDFGQYATAASQQQILFNQQFEALNLRLTNLGNGICNLGYEMQGNISQLGKEMALAQNGTNATITQTGNSIERQICNLGANIDAKFAALEKSQLEQRISEQAAQIARLEMDNRLYGVVRYPNGYTYNAGNSPFCGGGCGCCA